MKSFKEFVNENILGSELGSHLPKWELLKLQDISDKIKIIELKSVPLGGYVGKISVDGIEYRFDVYDNLGDWEYFIFDFPGSSVGNFPYDDKKGLQGNIEDIDLDLKDYLGIK